MAARRLSQLVMAAVLLAALCGGVDSSVGSGDGGDLSIALEHPAPGANLTYIPDVPLWVRIRKGRGQCFEVFLDGQSQTVTCDRDTVLEAWPLPGEHSIRLVATFLPSSRALVSESAFTIAPSAHALPAQPPACVHDYHKWWHSSNIWMRSTWRGVVAHKAPTDMWNYQEILHILKPTLVIEFGVHFGGATLFYSDVMQRVHAGAGGVAGKYKILSVDIEPWNMDKQVFEEINVETMSAYTASQRVQDRIREIRRQLPGPAFAILDADHSDISVLLELQMLTPVLQAGDYVIVEDTNLDGHQHAVAPGWGPSPYDAVTRFMALNRDLFERDFERELKFGFSQSMAGFLWFRGLREGAQVVNAVDENPWQHKEVGQS